MKELFQNSVNKTIHSTAHQICLDFVMTLLSSILSALDAENELLVQEALERLMKGNKN